MQTISNFKMRYFKTHKHTQKYLPLKKDPQWKINEDQGENETSMLGSSVALVLWTATYFPALYHFGEYFMCFGIAPQFLHWGFVYGNSTPSLNSTLFTVSLGHTLLLSVKD